MLVLSRDTVEKETDGLPIVGATILNVPLPLTQYWLLFHLAEVYPPSNIALTDKLTDVFVVVNVPLATVEPLDHWL